MLESAGERTSKLPVMRDKPCYGTLRGTHLLKVAGSLRLYLLPGVHWTGLKTGLKPHSPEPAVCPAHPQLEASPPDASVPSGLFLPEVIHCLVLFCLRQRLPAYTCLRTAVWSCSNPSQRSVLCPSQHLPSHIQPHLVWHCRHRQHLPRLPHLPHLVWNCSCFVCWTHCS
ncbi:hypothetical protein ACER0C_001207 [Sarotherodon galilaeus]